MVIPNCPFYNVGAKLSVFTMLVPNRPFSYLSAKLSGCLLGASTWYPVIFTFWDGMSRVTWEKARDGTGRVLWSSQGLVLRRGCMIFKFDLVKAVNAWDRSAFSNVFILSHGEEHFLDSKPNRKYNNSDNKNPAQKFTPPHTHHQSWSHKNQAHTHLLRYQVHDYFCCLHCFSCCYWRE